MKHAHRRIGYGFFVIVLAARSASAYDGPIPQQIDKLLAAVKPGTMRVVVCVTDLASGRPVYERAADELMKPASNMKLLTVAAALDLLPPDFRYRTTLGICGEDLVVVGSGDPSLGDPRLAQERNEPVTAIFHDWALKLQAKGISQIRGDLVIDDSAFEALHYNPNWPANQRQQWFSAPVGALNFNNNCIDVAVRPGPKVGDPALIEVIPPNSYVTIRNECRTGSRSGGGGPTIARKGDTPVYVVSGTCRTAGKLQPTAVPDPGLFFAGACRTSLAARGIRIEGQVRRQRVRDARGNLPASCHVVAVYERRLKDILRRINRNSQNLFAECLLKTLGAQLAGTLTEAGTGSYETGRRLVGLYLQKAGIARPAGVVIDDGSGFSPLNRVTARMLTQILTHMGRHPQSAAFRDSLAVPGEESTLKKRMKDLQGRVQAKTGYIAGVYALSGYAAGTSGATYCFSVLVNDAANGTAAKQLQDDICRVLVNEAQAAAGNSPRRR